MICNQIFFYVVAWNIYTLQGGFVPRGVFFAKVICAILLVISFYHFIIVNLDLKRPSYFWGLNLLVILFSIYGFLALLGFTTNPLPEEYLKTILISLLPIYSFFYFSKKGMISDKNFLFFIVVLLLFSILDFFGRIYSFSLRLGSGNIDFTNNSGYLFLPFVSASVFLYKKKFLQYFVLFICLLFTIESSKRGAIIICIACLFWFVFNDLKGKDVKIKLGVISLFFALSVLGAFFINKHMSESYHFQKKMMTIEDGSGRDYLYSVLTNYFWNETEPFHFLFGSGANATMAISTNYAHNDWLEIAINQGVVGVLLYLFYWLMFVWECNSIFYSRKIKIAMQLILVAYFMKTLFSMSYYSMPISATFILGYCLAQKEDFPACKDTTP